MKKKLLLLLCLSNIMIANAQDKIAPLEISGSVDTYYKYDFNKNTNIKTYFADEQNSVSIGMIDVLLKKALGKTSFLAELSYGPRGQYQSLPNANGAYISTENGFNIQNLYVSYNPSERLNLTAGYMSSFIGYEVISPVLNFNYSTSYLFSAGPFQNAGFKATYTFSNKLSLFIGVFNEWNQYKAKKGIANFGSQLVLKPNKDFYMNFNYINGLDAYGNYSNLVDFTSVYQVDSKFKLSVNTANLNAGGNKFGYTGIALYPQYDFNPNFALGLRTELFKYHGINNAVVSAYTLSGNVKIGGLIIIPEIRLDYDKNYSQSFLKKDGLSPNQYASQFCLATVYSF